MGVQLDLPGLPSDLFLIIASTLLEPVDIVRCRRVSTSWYHAFTDSFLLQKVLVSCHPNAREVRQLFQASRHGHNVPDDQWNHVYNTVVARYCSLRSGRARSTTRLKLYNDPYHSHETDQLPAFERLVGHWDRYLQQSRFCLLTLGTSVQNTQPIDTYEPGWTYEDGLLVYADAEVGAYVLLDVESNTTSIVPFEIGHGFVRRIRLIDHLLVIEWAETRPYHKLNDTEEVHRHFVTAFDVLQTHSFPWLPQWTAVFRNEWKLHYLGFPLTHADIWLSTHTANHYAAYIWQPNRSAWGEDEPIESLLIWDISQHSNDRPSKMSFTDDSGSRPGPQIVKKLSFPDLDYLTVRQRDDPLLRRIELDAGMLYFFEEQCLLESGYHVGLSNRRNADCFWERVVGIPILGPGPRWEDRKGQSSLDPVDLDSDHSTTTHSSTPKRATCWRYKDYPNTRNQIVHDKPANIQFSVEQHEIGVPEIWISSDDWVSRVELGDIAWQWFTIYGDERWLVIQSNQEIHILRFDCQLSNSEERLQGMFPKRKSLIPISNYVTVG